MRPIVKQKMNPRLTLLLQPHTPEMGRLFMNWAPTLRHLLRLPSLRFAVTNEPIPAELNPSWSEMGNHCFAIAIIPQAMEQTPDTNPPSLTL